MHEHELTRDSITKSTRRRSLKTLFQLPLSSRSPDFISASTAEAVGSIPADIVREIVDLLTPADVLNMSLTVSRFLVEWRGRLLFLPSVKASAVDVAASSL